MTNLVLTIVTPCVIIKSFMREYDKALLKSLLLSFLIVILLHAGFIVLSKLFIHSSDSATERVLQFGAIFGNCGFMSLPLQQALLGDLGVFYGSSYVAIFNLVAWSYGIILMSGDKKYLNPKRMIINPGICGLAIGLVLFFLSFKIPSVISEPVSYLASLNTPLPMIIIGYHLSQSKLIEGLKSIRCIFAMFLKLFFFPLLTLGVLYICNVRGTLLVSMVIASSAPSAAFTTMFSSKYGANTSLSVSMVSLTTLFSLISMPIVIALAQYIA